MERLIAATGGRPAKNEDLQLYLQNISIFEGFMNELPDSTNGFIVYGCEISGNPPSYSVSEGVIFYNGDLYILDAITGINPIDFTFDFQSVDGTPRTFFDGITKNTITKKSAILNGNGGTFNIATAVRFSEYLNKSESVLNITAAGTYQLTDEKFVIIQGSLSASDVTIQMPSPANSYIGYQVRILNRTTENQVVKTSAAGTQYPTTLQNDYYLIFENDGGASLDWICVYNDIRPIA